MKKSVTQDPAPCWTVVSPVCLHPAWALSRLWGQIMWARLPLRWRGVLSKTRAVDWLPDPLLACSSHSLSFPASRRMPQGQGKHSWWSSHSPLTAGHGEEFATAPAPRSGRQMTSVSDQWECQVIPAWWDYSSEGHEESVPPEEEKNSWHRGPPAPGNVGSQADRLQVWLD